MTFTMQADGRTYKVHTVVGQGLARVVVEEVTEEQEVLTTKEIQ
jgi:hypothetical protein